MKIGIVREEHKNKKVTASKEGSLYWVEAFENGRLVNWFSTYSKEEAQEVYSNTVYAMYK